MCWCHGLIRYSTVADRRCHQHHSNSHVTHHITQYNHVIIEGSIKCHWLSVLCQCLTSFCTGICSRWPLEDSDKDSYVRVCASAKQSLINYTPWEMMRTLMRTPHVNGKAARPQSLSEDSKTGQFVSHSSWFKNSVAGGPSTKAPHPPQSTPLWRITASKDVREFSRGYERLIAQQHG